MRQYRAYLFDDEGHNLAPAIIISAPDDDNAVRLATVTVGGFDVELWHNKRLVKRLPHRWIRRAQDPT